jgi:ABC-type polysaccharide transport system permease subunit
MAASLFESGIGLLLVIGANAVITRIDPERSLW